MLREPITIPLDSPSKYIEGELALPSEANSVVLFAHGSGSSRFSPRNTYVASVLQQAGIGTLLFDLLTHEEEISYENRFDIALLTKRLIAATDMLTEDPRTKSLSIGYFGASTGAAAALMAAAKLGIKISAIVSRGGRPDLADEQSLRQVFSPTLLIVGANDDGVINLNQKAYAYLSCEKEISIVPGATHLFEEPGTLEQVANIATLWFARSFKKMGPVSS